MEQRDVLHMRDGVLARKARKDSGEKGKMPKHMRKRGRSVII